MSSPTNTKLRFDAAWATMQQAHKNGCYHQFFWLTITGVTSIFLTACSAIEHPQLCRNAGGGAERMNLLLGQLQHHLVNIASAPCSSPASKTTFATFLLLLPQNPSTSTALPLRYNKVQCLEHIPRREKIVVLTLLLLLNQACSLQPC